MALAVIFLAVMIAAFVGGLVGTITSLFYTIPAARRGKRGLAAFKEIPPWNRRLIIVSVGIFLVGLAVSEIYGWVHPIAAR